MIDILILMLLLLVSSTTSCLCPGSPGDLLVFTRLEGFYHHYAINVGNGYIVHMTGGKDDLTQCFRSTFLMRRCEKAEVKKEKCADVAKPGSRVYIEHESWKTKVPLPRNEIIERALSKVGTSGYHLLYNNCEHFARWCRYGEESSKQADNMMLAGFIIKILGETILLILFITFLYLLTETFVILVMALFRALHLLSHKAMVETSRLFMRGTDVKMFERKLQQSSSGPHPSTWYFLSVTILGFLSCCRRFSNLFSLHLLGCSAVLVYSLYNSEIKKPSNNFADHHPDTCFMRND